MSLEPIKQRIHSAMALWSFTKLCWIACCAVVAYSFHKSDGNVGATFLEKIGHLENSADEETLAIRENEAVSTARNDDPEFASQSETGELDDERMAMMNVLRCDGKNKTENCVRNRRSVGEGVPNLCADAKLDTVTRIEDGRTYAFKGNHYWKVREHGIPEGYPKLISPDWDGLPGNLDASFTFASGKTYFFKGSQYWRFVNKKMDNGYPKQISQRFPGIPDDLDAALVWRGDGKIYFFKGTVYWRFDFSSDPNVDPRYPQSISDKWSSLLANGIDAAFHWEGRHLYLFKDHEFYRYNAETSEVDVAIPPYPHSTARNWLHCPSS